LRHWRVARRHARLAERAEGVFVEDVGSLGGTLVNGRRILQYGPLLPEDEIVVGAAMLRVRPAAAPVPAPPSSGGPPAPAPAARAMVAAVRADDAQAHEAAMVEWRRRLHVRLLEALDLRRRDVSAMSDAALRLEADRLLEALVLD